jgi:hypothetical protein
MLHYLFVQFSFTYFKNTIMKKNIIKIDSILKELKTMHEFLGGGTLKADYTQ